MNAIVVIMAICQLITLVIMVRMIVVEQRLREVIRETEDIKDVVQDVIEDKPLVPEAGDSKREARKKAKLNRKSQRIKEKILRSEL